MAKLPSATGAKRTYAIMEVNAIARKIHTPENRKSNKNPKKTATIQPIESI